ncbi:MAG: aldehyde dehydrogenase family protein [Candidatus Eisenbacteria bacterium]
MQDWLRSLGIGEVNSGVSDGQWFDNPSGGELTSVSPIDGKPIARVLQASEAEYELVLQSAVAAFETWKMIPAPKRGEIVREIGLELREHKDALGRLVTLEMGKILTEGQGEVQEMIDMADFAVGLSRQLYGLTMHSERPRHRMYEQWHPLGVVGIVTAFNFPVAVWSWNAMIAAVCGDTMVWKPSSLTPLTAIATQKIAERVVARHGLPRGIFNLVIGRGSTIGERMIHDKRIPLVSATGSTPMGQRIGEVVAKRLGRSLLELGGNNAILVMEDADPKLALRAILFGAVGTAGQRCTSTRRIFVHRAIAEEFTAKLLAAYKTIRIGDPLDPATLMGPLVDEDAVETMMRALDAIRAQGGEILYGGRKLDRPGYYVEPALVRAHPAMAIVREETFAPILYLFTVGSFEEAMELHNGVDQGLSSAIFTRNLQYAERFLSHQGSDCGIANVNIGTSGAEIGGAFGGEKETGGGREAGSDAWKTYMRRQTCTINWSDELPLAQGVQFGD